jgi:RimJ/RimL family protein N-acetyltransferase
LIAANRDHLQRNFPELTKNLFTADEAKSYFESCMSQWNAGKTYCFAVWTRTPRGLIGQLKVKNVNWQIPSAELSYFIGRAFLRRGYATEAMTAVMHMAFKELQFNRVQVRIIASNMASLRLAQKLGMQHEGLHRNEFRCGYGELHDVHYYSFTRNDYVMQAADAGKPAPSRL